MPTPSTNSMLSLLYPTVLYLLPGEILLLECQLPWAGEGLLGIKGLGSGGGMKQLPFFPSLPGSPRSMVPLYFPGSCPALPALCQQAGC